MRKISVKWNIELINWSSVKMYIEKCRSGPKNTFFVCTHALICKLRNESLNQCVNFWIWETIQKYEAGFASLPICDLRREEKGASNSVGRFCMYFSPSEWVTCAEILKLLRVKIYQCVWRSLPKRVQTKWRSDVYLSNLGTTLKQASVPAGRVPVSVCKQQQRKESHLCCQTS